MVPEVYNGVFQITNVNGSNFSFVLPADYYFYSTSTQTQLPTPYVNASLPAPELPGQAYVPEGRAVKVVQEIATYFQYDGDGRLVQETQPTALNLGSFNDSQSDIIAPMASAYTSSGVITNSSVAGWSFEGLAGITANPSSNSGNYVIPPWQNGFGVTNTTYNAPDGSEAAFIQGGGAISQTFAVANQGTYTLTFQYEGTFPYSNYRDYTAIDVLVDGNVESLNNASDTGYQTATLSVALSAGVNTIELLGVGTSGGNDVPYGDSLIDAVTLEPSGGGASVLSDGSFEALHLSPNAYQYDPTAYPITATATTPVGTVAGYVGKPPTCPVGLWWELGSRRRSRPSI